jgi:hypothetical protein
MLRTIACFFIGSVRFSFCLSTHLPIIHDSSAVFNISTLLLKFIDHCLFDNHHVDLI